MKIQNLIKRASSGILASLLCISMLFGQVCTAYAADDGTPVYTGPGTMDISLAYKSSEEATISAAPGTLIAFPRYTISATYLRDDDRGYSIVGDGVTQSLIYSASYELSGQTSSDTCITDSGIQIGADETASTITLTLILDYAYIRLRIANDPSSERWYHSASPAASLPFTIYISSADTDSEVSSETGSGEASENNTEDSGSSGNTSEAGSNEESENNTEDSGSSENTDNSVQEEVSTNTVILSGGATISSTVSGVYTAKTVGGTALTTDKSEISSAAGLSEQDIKDGTNVAFYICDNHNAKAQEVINSAASSIGRKAAAYLTADMYTISSKGTINKIKTTTTPLTLVIGVPESLQNSSHNFSAVFIDAAGTIVTYEDIDTDPYTITIQTSTFGDFAIIY